jgi:adenosylhomocysteine nucleosidase
LRRAAGAAVVDMESLIVGRLAGELEAPCAIPCAVADPAERNLPPLAAKAIGSQGRIDAGAIVVGLARPSGQAASLDWGTTAELLSPR